MSSQRSYIVDSGNVSIGGTSATPALYVAAQSTSDFNIVGIRCSVAAGSSPAPPSNGSILAQLSVPTGSAAGGAAVTPRPTGQSSLAALTTGWKSGSTAITGLTIGNILWTADIALTSGAIWGEWFPTGFERNVPASGLIAVYFTAASGAGTNMNFHVSLEFAE